MMVVREFPNIALLRRTSNVVVNADDQFAAISSEDATIRDHQLFSTADVGTLDLRPPIHRFLERWTPGDPFVHLGQLWAR